MKIELGLIIEDKSWKKEEFAKKQYVTKIIRKVLDLFPGMVNTKFIETAVLLTDNSKMQQLNLEFCGKNSPTNVLSFPDAVINKDEILELSYKKEYIYIGDIAIGYNIVMTEAIERNISMKDHFTHMIVHSVLHLIGYDHKVQIEEKQMMELEIKILKSLDIKSPYR